VQGILEEIMDKKTQPTKTPDVANSKMITVEWWLKLVALIGVTVSLLGYGVVTGLASAITLDHGSILSGPFDLLSLVWPGAVLLVTAIDKIDFLSILGTSFSQALPVALAAFVMIVLSSIFMRYRDRLRKIDRAWFKAKVVPSEHETIRTTIQKALFVTISTFTAYTFATLLGFVGIFGILLFLLTVPVIGFSAGQAYFNEYILKPKHCVSIVPGSTRLEAKKKASSETGVTCALVKSIDKDNSYRNHGRVVLSSSSYMLMYHFDTGVGERIPVAGLVIQSIDDAGIAALVAEDASSENKGASIKPKEEPHRSKKVP
jgi:hypothetical protein